MTQSFSRLGGLLALGFGEAGAEVIGQNMKAASETWRDVARRGFSCFVMLCFPLKEGCCSVSVVLFEFFSLVSPQLSR